MGRRRLPHALTLYVRPGHFCGLSVHLSSVSMDSFLPNQEVPDAREDGRQAEGSASQTAASAQHPRHRQGEHLKRTHRQEINTHALSVPQQMIPRHKMAETTSAVRQCEKHRGLTNADPQALTSQVCIRMAGCSSL